MENPDIAVAASVAAVASATPTLKIDRQGLHEAVATRLRDLIIEGHLAPGTRLNARLLCEKLPGYYRLNRAIHERINAAARNPVLTQVYRTVNARLHALRFRSNFDRAKWDAAMAEHEQMLVALEKRDGERLRRILVEHLAKKC